MFQIKVTQPAGIDVARETGQIKVARANLLLLWEQTVLDTVHWYILYTMFTFRACVVLCCVVYLLGPESKIENEE